MRKEFDPIFQTLEAHSGITVANAHREYMEKLILERTGDLGVSPTEYNSLIHKDDAELSYLTNAAAVNETYFFREERQFDFLKNDIFLKQKDRKLQIWSASCSTGEEALSIYTLAKSCGLNFSIFASDIDTDALASFKAGIYTQNSFRTDGSKYRPLIETVGNWEDDKMHIQQDIISHITIFNYNLASCDPPPIPEASIDIIFMRNVFIYFTPEVRKKILNKIAKSLKEDGIVILSINEVGNIDKNGIPFEKKHSDTVYYLQKGIKTEGKKKSTPLIHDTETTLLHPTSNQGQNSYRPRPQSNSSIELATHTRKEGTGPCIVPEISKSKSTQIGKPPLEIPPSKINKQSSCENKLSIQELYEKLEAFINKHDLEAARKSLQEKIFKPHEMEFKYFFSALICIDENADDKALEELEKSVMLNACFWPARYRLAVLQHKQGEKVESMKNFEACKNSIAQYKQGAQKEYDFLIGQFSPEYFEMLCSNYLKSLKEG